MANGEDLVETLRRFNLFADLDRAQLEAIADPDSERSFGAGERILRRGMSGSGFVVILDGEASGHARRGEAEPPPAGRLLRRDLDAAHDEPLTRGCHRGDTGAQCLEIPGPRLEAVPAQLSEGHAADARHGGATVAGSPRLAVSREPTSARRVSRSSSSAAGRAACRRPTHSAGSAIEHAVISQDDCAGRHVPHACRSTSACSRWTQAGRAVRAAPPREYEWYDHNSLIADEPEHQARDRRGRDGSHLH